MSDGNKVYFQVIEHIKNLAMDGRVELGGKIPSERELMETLGLSRNSIREALRTLENMGIIESRHGKGNFLVNRTGESLSSVFSMLLLMKESSFLEVSQIRRGMEILAFHLAADRMGEKERQEFQEVMEEMSRASGGERNQADHRFHRLLIQSSGNRLLGLLMEALSQVCRDEITMILSHATMDSHEKWLELHGRIGRCLLNGDKMGGQEAILEHYQWIDRELQEEIRDAPL